MRRRFTLIQRLRAIWRMPERVDDVEMRFNRRIHDSSQGLSAMVVTVQRQSFDVLGRHEKELRHLQKPARAEGGG